MKEYHVTEEQVAKYTRMDADRLHQVLVGEVVMNINDYVDIYYAIPHSDEIHIPAEKHGVDSKLVFSHQGVTFPILPYLKGRKSNRNS